MHTALYSIAHGVQCIAPAKKTKTKAHEKNNGRGLSIFSVVIAYHG